MALGMADQHNKLSTGENQRSKGPFPRFQERREQGWQPVELGGHEVVSRLQMQLRPGPAAAAEGRHTLDRLDGSLDKAQLDILKLLITELITNSVRHGGSDAWIALEIELYANAVRVEVVDRGPGFQPKETPTPHADRRGGYGLCLVDSLANDWGVSLNQGTRVWFELDRERRDFAPAAA